MKFIKLLIKNIYFILIKIKKYKSKIYIIINIIRKLWRSMYKFISLRTVWVWFLTRVIQPAGWPEKFDPQPRPSIRFLVPVLVLRLCGFRGLGSV